MTDEEYKRVDMLVDAAQRKVDAYVASPEYNPKPQPSVAYLRWEYRRLKYNLPLGDTK